MAGSGVRGRLLRLKDVPALKTLLRILGLGISLVSASGMPPPKKSPANVQDRYCQHFSDYKNLIRFGKGDEQEAMAKLIDRQSKTDLREHLYMAQKMRRTGKLKAQDLLPGYPRPGESFSEDDFILQAQTLRDHLSRRPLIEEFAVTYRTDSRSPRQIFAQSHSLFTPNPKLAPGTLQTHYVQSGGTGSWVSVAREPGIAQVVNMVLRGNDERPVFEYQFHNVRGYDTGLENEAEVIARAIPVTSTTKVRHIILLEDEARFAIPSLQYQIHDTDSSILVSEWVPFADSLKVFGNSRKPKWLPTSQ